MGRLEDGGLVSAALLDLLLAGRGWLLAEGERAVGGFVSRSER